MTRIFQKKREINNIHCTIKYMTAKQYHDPYMIEFTDNRTRPSLKILCTLIRYPSAKKEAGSKVCVFDSIIKFQVIVIEKWTKIQNHSQIGQL